MLKSIVITLFVVSLFLFCGFSLAEYSEPNTSIQTKERIPIFYVLLKEDSNASVSAQEIQNAKHDAKTGFNIAALNNSKYIKVRRMVSESGYKFSRSKNANGVESARSKLGRYLVLEFDKSVDIDQIYTNLKSDPLVEYVVTDYFINLSAACPNSGGAITNYSNFSKNWGFNKVRASNGWAYSTGHAYIGVVDIGVQMNHAALKDFNGNTYLAGNFHPQMAFDAGARITTNGTLANPFTGLAYYGEVDEYFSKVAAADANHCDDLPNGNNDGYNQSWRAGHGTAVFGVIAAKGNSSGGTQGICKHCPVSVAKAGYPSQCIYGNQPFTGQPYEAVNHAFTTYSAYAAAAFQIDIGVSVINQSSGGHGTASSFCTSYPTNPACLTLQYAADRDVVWVSSAGNDNDSSLDWPANDKRVIGVTGSTTNGTTRWTEYSSCGSNYGGTSDYNGPSLMAPAKAIYTTMYADMDWNELLCHEYNDDNGIGGSEMGDGYGYCTGTSLSAPFVSGVAGLIKSVNPLLSESDVYSALKASTGYSTWNNTRGWGTPRADYALKKALGIVGGVQVRNRAIPLFSLYGVTGKDFIQTSKPQIVLAFTINTTMNADSDNASPVVAGFSFAESSDNTGTPPTPRADVFILSTHYSVPSGHTVVPIYRISWVGAYAGNPSDTDWTLVKDSEISGFHSVGYDMDGIEGYIYAPCSPEPSCIPTGTTKLWRSYNASRDDHAVFPQSRYTAMVSAGYNQNITKLGYAYPNQDSDSDGLIDGLEFLIGTNPSDADSDNDGTGDAIEYPLDKLPVSDPDN